MTIGWIIWLNILKILLMMEHFDNTLQSNWMWLHIYVHSFYVVHVYSILSIKLSSESWCSLMKKNNMPSHFQLRLCYPLKIKIKIVLSTKIYLFLFNFFNLFIFFDNFFSFNLIGMHILWEIIAQVYQINLKS